MDTYRIPFLDGSVSDEWSVRTASDAADLTTSKWPYDQAVRTHCWILWRQYSRHNIQEIIEVSAKSRAIVKHLEILGRFWAVASQTPMTILKGVRTPYTALLSLMEECLGFA